MAPLAASAWPKHRLVEENGGRRSPTTVFSDLASDEPLSRVPATIRSAAVAMANALDEQAVDRVVLGPNSPKLSATKSAADAHSWKRVGRAHILPCLISAVKNRSLSYEPPTEQPSTMPARSAL